MPREYDSDEFLRELEEKEAKLKAIRLRMVEIAYSLIGEPAIRYRSPEQGASRKGFDCSGFIKSLIEQAASEQKVSINVPRHANEQWREFGEPVHYGQRSAGDLVYFPTRRKRDVRIVGHVGLVVSSDEYIHSPGKDNTVVATGLLLNEQQPIPDITPDYIYTHTPVGIKRLSLPIGTGRWHVH